MFAAMVVVTLIVWVIALNRPPDVTEAAVCNPPADAAADPTQSRLGEQVTRASMTEVGPANLADTKIRVLNASGQVARPRKSPTSCVTWDSPSRRRPTTRCTRTAGWRARSDPSAQQPGAAAAVWLVARASNCSRPTTRRHRGPGHRHRLHRAGAQRRHRSGAVSLRPEATNPPIRRCCRKSTPRRADAIPLRRRYSMATVHRPGSAQPRTPCRRQARPQPPFRAADRPFRGGSAARPASAAISARPSSPRR
jgi:hypothetical protein